MVKGYEVFPQVSCPPPVFSLPLTGVNPFRDLTGTVLSVDLLGPFKKIGFGEEGGMTLEEMRQEAMQVFGQPKLFM
jgi:hypothetical protein